MQPNSFATQIKPPIATHIVLSPAENNDCAIIDIPSEFDLALIRILPANFELVKPEDSIISQTAKLNPGQRGLVRIFGLAKPSNRLLEEIELRDLQSNYFVLPRKNVRLLVPRTRLSYVRP